MSRAWEPVVPWTAEEDARLAQIIGEGRSANFAAGVVGKSRNACIGRARRLKLAFKGGEFPHRKPAADHPLRAPKAKPPVIKPTKQHLHTGNIAGKKAGRAFDPGLPAKLVEVREPVTGTVSLMELRPGQCKWPVSGERADTMFCAKAVTEIGSSWCAFHHRIVFTPAQLRRRAA